MLTRPFRLLVLLLLLCMGGAQARDFFDWHRSAEVPVVAAERLPAEAREVLALIRQGGPFAYRRDGITFQNREQRLPDAPAGFYREYTVSTPGASTRGARRIVSGGRPAEVFYYSDDHYRSFRRIRD